MMNITCFLLAAGQSLRMGEVNKLLLPIAGKSFVRRTAEQLTKIPFHEIVVVTGHDGQSVQAELKDLPVKFVHNPAYAVGMHGSIRAGLLNSWVAETEGFVVCLADQPYFDGKIIEKLAGVFLQSQRPRILFPIVEEKRGHPVFISSHFIPEILGHVDGDFGCSYLFALHPDALVPVIESDECVLIDVDTKQQYEDLRGRT